MDTSRNIHGSGNPPTNLQNVNPASNKVPNTQQGRNFDLFDDTENPLLSVCLKFFSGITKDPPDSEGSDLLSNITRILRNLLSNLLSAKSSEYHFIEKRSRFSLLKPIFQVTPTKILVCRIYLLQWIRATTVGSITIFATEHKA